MSGAIWLLGLIVRRTGAVMTRRVHPLASSLSKKGEQCLRLTAVSIAKLPPGNECFFER